jgi:hypothetical protein
MRKLLILLLLVSFCGGSSETATVEDTTTTSSSSTSTSTSTTSSSTTTSSTTTTVKVPQAPALRLDLCSDELNPTETENWAYEIEIINFNSKIKAIEYILYFNEEEVAKERESFVVNENQNEYYGLQSTIALTENGYNLKVKTTVFTVDDLETEIVCETRVLGAKELNISASSDTTTTTTITTPVSEDDIQYSGSGDSVVNIDTFNTLKIIEIAGNNAESVFVVTPYQDSEELTTLVLTGQAYRGIRPLNFDENPNSIVIQAKGDWRMTIKPVSSADSFTGNSITGTGDSVIQFYDNQNTFQDITITGNDAEGVFAITSYSCSGEYNSLLVLTGEKYEGTVRSDSNTCFLVIRATGSWSISR